ncbi:MAG: hypothetical protein JSW27_22400 [Phycisphaerales bacterium]|nr:MAG: hypothetical protein JSW27_22400 [Phycisphaerales bacterium]
MSTSAGKSLTASQVRKLLGHLELAATREACWSCECLQGIITQLELDAAADAKLLLETYEVRPERLHGCLGCDPCPPAEAFVDYRKTR